jgi:hypothetical protein
MAPTFYLKSDKYHSGRGIIFQGKRYDIPKIYQVSTDCCINLDGNMFPFGVYYNALPREVQVFLNRTFQKPDLQHGKNIFERYGKKK